MPAMRILWFVVSITTLSKDEAHLPKHDLFIGGVPSILEGVPRLVIFACLAHLLNFIAVWFHKCLLVCSNVKIE